MFADGNAEDDEAGTSSGSRRGVEGVDGELMTFLSGEDVEDLVFSEIALEIEGIGDIDRFTIELDKLSLLFEVDEDFC